MPPVHHRTASVDGLEIFYREAGPDDAPVLLLLHGYPMSSHMFRHLIPVLAQEYRVVAPDHIGFGRSSAPSVEGVISQNGNAYEEGFVPDFWEPIWAYGADRSEGAEAALRPALGRARRRVAVHPGPPTERSTQRSRSGCGDPGCRSSPSGGAMTRSSPPPGRRRSGGTSPVPASSSSTAGTSCSSPTSTTSSGSSGSGAPSWHLSLRRGARP